MQRTFLRSSRLDTVSGLTLRNISEQLAEPTDWRCHESHHVFGILNRGRLRSMDMAFEHGPTGRLVPEVGHIVVIPANVRFAARAYGTSIEVTELWVPTALLADEVKPRIGARDPLLFFAAARMSAVAEREDLAARLLRDSLAETIGLHLREHYGRGVPSADGPHVTFNSALANRVVDYLDDELDSDITLQTLADLAGMPVAAFGRAFAATFGTTPYQFVLNRRLESAKRMLAHTTTSVAEIGAAVGFSTPSHFATTFRRRVGVTPSRYRKEIGDGNPKPGFPTGPSR